MAGFDHEDCRGRRGGAEAGESSGERSEGKGMSGGAQSHDGPERERDRRGFSVLSPKEVCKLAARRRMVRLSAGAIVTMIAVISGITLFHYGGALRGADAGIESGGKPNESSLGASSRVHGLLRFSADEIQRRIDRARDGSVVEVPPGLYEGSIEIRAKSVTLRSRDGASTTVLQGGPGSGPVVVIRDIASDRSPALELRGFTIRGGRGLGGAGVVVERADPVIAECVIERNADGGVRLVDSRAIIDGCHLRSNATAMLGGGAQCVGSDATFVNCVFQGNMARTGGGAIATQGGAPIVLLSRFDGNRSVSGAWGGALFIDGSELTVLDSEFVRNGSADEGGAIYLRGGSARIERSAFEANASRTAWSILSHGAAVRVSFTRFCGPLDWNIHSESLDQRDNEFTAACVRDCNGNGVPDDIEISDGSVADCDESGVPDPCKLDCDGDGIPDVCAISMGFVRDDNRNGIPDACEEPMMPPAPSGASD